MLLYIMWTGMSLLYNVDWHVVLHNVDWHVVLYNVEWHVVFI